MINPGSLAVNPPKGAAPPATIHLSFSVDGDATAAALCRPQARGRQYTARHPPFRWVIGLEGLGMCMGMRHLGPIGVILAATACSRLWRMLCLCVFVYATTNQKVPKPTRAELGSTSLLALARTVVTFDSLPSWCP
jgi:hypothetical protein